jgi:hypothetical protein
MSPLDSERRLDIGDDWAEDARRGEGMYRECERYGCSSEAGWQDEDTGEWFCPEHAK